MCIRDRRVQMLALILVHAFDLHVEQRVRVDLLPGDLLQMLGEDHLVGVCLLYTSRCV